MKTIAKTGMLMAAIALLTSCDFFNGDKKPDAQHAEINTTVTGIDVDSSDAPIVSATTVTGAVE